MFPSKLQEELSGWYQLNNNPGKIFFLIFLLGPGNFAIHAQEDKIPFLPQSGDTAIVLREVKVKAYGTNGRLQTTPGSISVLNGRELLVTDGLSLSTAINTMPGVTMQSGTYATGRIVIRGMGSRTPFNTNRIRSYLNDIPLTTSDGVSTPEEIDLSGIGRMEVIKGPASALYGSGLGGSINMYLPVKTQNEGNIETQYGSFNTGRAFLSGSVKSGNANLWGSLSHLNSRGYRENNHYRRTTLISTAKWKQEKWSISPTLLLIHVNAGIPSSVGLTQFENNPGQAAPNWNAIHGYKEYIKGIAAAELVNNLTDRLTSQITVFGRLNDNYEKRPFNNLDDRSLSGGFRYRLSHQTARTEWIAGAEWIAEQYMWKLDENGAPINENSETRRQLNAFAMLYYRPVQTINISLAGALNHITYRLNDRFPANGDQSGRRTFPLVFSPRIGINYSPSDMLAFYASAGHGFSLPSPEETLLPAGDVNPDIRPEQGFQYEMGTRLDFAAGVIEIDASIYWIELNDLLVTKRITEDIFTGTNAGKTRHQGLELFIRSHLFDKGNFPGRLTSTLSYTRSLNRFIDFTDNGISYDGNHLPGIPDQSVQLQLRWNTLKIFEVFSLLQYTGYQYLNDDNTLEYPGYFLLNIRIASQFRWKDKSGLSIFAGINNATNTQYASMLVVNALGFGTNEPRYYYPGLPGNFYSGVRISF